MASVWSTDHFALFSPFCFYFGENLQHCLQSTCYSQLHRCPWSDNHAHFNYSSGQPLKIMITPKIKRGKSSVEEILSHDKWNKKWMSTNPCEIRWEGLSAWRGHLTSKQRGSVSPVIHKTNSGKEIKCLLQVHLAFSKDWSWWWQNTKSAVKTKVENQRVKLISYME